MALRGPYIGDGRVPGIGMVRIFTDLDSTDHLFVIPTKKDEARYVSRGRVQFRKRKVGTK